MKAGEFAKVVAINVAATVVAMWLINKIPQLRALTRG